MTGCMIRCAVPDLRSNDDKGRRLCCGSKTSCLIQHAIFSLVQGFPRCRLPPWGCVGSGRLSTRTSRSGQYSCANKQAGPRSFAATFCGWQRCGSPTLRTVDESAGGRSEGAVNFNFKRGGTGVKTVFPNCRRPLSIFALPSEWPQRAWHRAKVAAPLWVACAVLSAEGRLSNADTKPRIVT
jgi:hypothetical protein